ncbi:hypothetical protein EDEG_00286 [Edhazardia aedis USNM 41457]|uniref:Uncharacterized protein n=1 Tax=Edhazardia aedis (strain USNM 41457) TaxID=1003232 RepID=J9DII7_EDHAE|nr:hypothetical protein EDEG_00286 [Edhazardia aedis USNM 41457]|eukprot:EJW02430.1 hypothetical protein EDEG_00286 [Edhazardia aedis USNM 41457]
MSIVETLITIVFIIIFINIHIFKLENKLLHTNENCKNSGSCPEELSKPREIFLPIKQDKSHKYFQIHTKNCDKWSCDQKHFKKIFGIRPYSPSRKHVKANKLKVNIEQNKENSIKPLIKKKKTTIISEPNITPQENQRKPIKYDNKLKENDKKDINGVLLLEETEKTSVSEDKKITKTESKFTEKKTKILENTENPKFMSLQIKNELYNTETKWFLDFIDEISKNKTLDASKFSCVKANLCSVIILFEDDNDYKAEFSVFSRLTSNAIDYFFKAENTSNGLQFRKLEETEIQDIEERFQNGVLFEEIDPTERKIAKFSTKIRSKMHCTVYFEGKFQSYSKIFAVTQRNILYICKFPSDISANENLLGFSATENLEYTRNNEKNDYFR